MGRKSDQTVAWGKRAIAALPTPPAGKRVTYHHPDNNRLVIIVTDRGARTFYYVVRIDGRQERIRIGPSPALSPGAAVDRAKEIEEAIAKGENPNQQRREHRAASTAGLYWDEMFYPKHVQQKLKPRTQEQYRDTWKNHLKPIFDRKKLHAISRADVKQMHADITARGKGRTANLAVAVLRSMLNHALDLELIPGPNPCDRIKLNRETKRERFLSTEEIVKLYQELDKHAASTGDWTVHDVVKLLLLTGQRRSNVLEMRWRHIDLQQQKWVIPKKENKSGNRDYVVHLAPGAVDILQRRAEEAASRAGDVFPAPKDMKLLSYVRREWEAVRAAAGLEDVRLHDLRHTLASIMANNGATLQTIGHQLGHANIATTQRYAHLVDATVASAVDGALARIGSDKK